MQRTMTLASCREYGAADEIRHQLAGKLTALGLAESYGVAVKRSAGAWLVIVGRHDDAPMTGRGRIAPFLATHRVPSERPA